MPDSPSYSILVVAPGPRISTVGEALSALVSRDRRRLDELHVLVPGGAAIRARASLLRPRRGTLPQLGTWVRRQLVKRDCVFDRSTIHSVGAAPLSDAPWDDLVETLRHLCGDPSHTVAVVSSFDAGTIGILAHTALQLVGKISDRFYVLESESRRSRTRARTHHARTLVELPLLPAERPLAPDRRFHDLLLERRAARRRLAIPGTLMLDATRLVVHIDDVELRLPRLQFFWYYVLGSLAPAPFPLRDITSHVNLKAGSVLAFGGSGAERARLEAIAAHVRQTFAALFRDDDEFIPVFMRACGPSPGLPSVVSKINARLRREFGIGAEPCLIAGGRGADGYRLTRPPKTIVLEPHSPGKVATLVQGYAVSAVEAAGNLARNTELLHLDRKPDG